MNLIIVNLNDICDCFISSCILKGLRKKYKNKNIHIDCLVKNSSSSVIFKHNKHIRHVFTLNNIDKYNFNKYDMLVNFSQNCPTGIKADKNFGIGFSGNKDQFYEEVMFGNKHINKNIYQICYRLAGLTWRGEGCEIFYRPKFKNNNNITGMAIANSNLRRYITKRLNLNESTLRNIQYRKNILKKIDQINKYSNVITDDYFTMHLAVYLRKYVFFLKTLPYNTSIELFNKGKVITIPMQFV